MYVVLPVGALRGKRTPAEGVAEDRSASRSEGEPSPDGWLRRKEKEMGVYRKGKVYYIDYYFEGRRIREAVGSNRRQAELALASRKGEIAQGRFNLQKVKPPPYFDDFCREYAEWAEVQHRSFSSSERMRIGQFCRFFHGRRLAEITAWLIERYKQERRDRVSAATLNRELVVLSSMLSRAIEWGHLREHPMKGGRVKKLREQSPKERILSYEEELKLLQSCQGWFRGFVITALDTGMRLSEILNLQREDINLGQRVMTVRNTKSGKDRKIPLTQRVFSLVQERMRDPDPSGYLFPHGSGKRPWHVRLRFARACRRAALAGLRFHDLRHTFATRLVTSGVDLATVQRLLGHQDLRMTVRYSHPGSEDIKKAIRTLDRMAGDGHYLDTIEKTGLQAISITP